MSAEMTSMQRVLATMAHREPDRVSLLLATTMHGARELVLLDTDPASDGDARLKEMSNAVGLPASRVVVSLDFVRERLGSVIENWRARAAVRNEKRLREDADQTALLDLMARLSAAQQESEIIAETCGIFTMLFAPAKLFYFSVEHGQWCIPENASSSATDEVKRLSGAYAWTQSERGFMVRVCRGEQPLAVLYADDLAFPEYKERYLNMALSLAGIIALAIEGARTRRILVEAEKMASLSVLVAGVAHEVNTPVGVCLATATTLEAQMHTLAAKFANRTMTHSDLNRYLESASAEVKLIVSNLERMGGIIDAFRKVAIERTQPAKKWFVFRGLIEQAIAATGKGELGDALAVAIACDPTLAIHGYSSDWTSIVSNLYTNALRHAFRGRASGSIRITARTEAKELIFEFDDDGAGIAPEVLKHIFDPFYTTDMQHGMGLGMHLVYNLARKYLGGTIVCESTQGAGTHVRIAVPL